MSAGYQSVQPAHALAQFAIEHKDIFQNWQTNHKNLIVLSVEDENELTMLLLRARSEGLKISAFLEPDINNELTAIAMEPHEETYAMTSHLPLALKDYTRKDRALALSG